MKELEITNLKEEFTEWLKEKNKVHNVQKLTAFCYPESDTETLFKYIKNEELEISFMFFNTET